MVHITALCKLARVLGCLVRDCPTRSPCQCTRREPECHGWNQSLSKCSRNMGCGSRPTPCSGVSEFGASDSPCNGLAASTAG